MGEKKLSFQNFILKNKDDFIELIPEDKNFFEDFKDMINKSGN